MAITLAYIGLAILNFIGVTVLISSIGYFFTITIQPYYILLSFGLVVFQLWLAICSKRSGASPKVPKEFIRIVIGLLLTIFISVLLAGLLHDFSWDGQTYHQDAVIQLANGWNPVYDDGLNQQVVHEIAHEKWIISYSKGLWEFAAAVYKLTGYIETGKAYQWLLVMSALFLVFYAARHNFNSNKYRLATCILFVANPVTIVQVATYYNDGAIYLLFVTLISAAYIRLFCENGLLDFRMLDSSILFSLIVVSNVKFTGLIYAIVFCAGLVFFARYGKSERRMLKISVAALILSVFVVGFNPYITNFIRRGNPFWPLMGKNAVDIISSQEHPDFLKQNRVVKVLWANFGKIRNRSDFNNAQVQLELGTPKIALNILPSVEELKVYARADARIGGFGPWFGLALFMCLPLAIMLLRIGVDKKYILLAGGIALSVLVNPEAWWARYAPQLWMIPASAFVYSCYAMKDTRNKSLKLVTRCLFAILTLNVLIVVLISGVVHLKLEYYLHKQMNAINEYTHKSSQHVKVDLGQFQAVRIRFQENGIPYENIKGLDEKEFFHLVGTNAKIFLDVPNMTYR